MNLIEFLFLYSTGVMIIIDNQELLLDGISFLVLFLTHLYIPKELPWDQKHHYGSKSFNVIPAYLTLQYNFYILCSILDTAVQS